MRTDIFSKEKRSEIMSRVKSRDSEMEVSFRKKLWNRGFRYLKNSGKYFGKPDVVLPKHETVIFIDSCFWHRCEKHYRPPKTRAKFWKDKIERNKRRDDEVNAHYGEKGWKVIRIWEHDLKSKEFEFDFETIKRKSSFFDTVKKNELKAVDFFSGAGGLTHGLKAAGIHVLAGIDNEGSCKATFEKNNEGAVFLERDMTRYSPEDLERDMKIEKKDDRMIFAGCAPCQFWSIIQTNKEKSEKSKNLIMDFQKFVEYFEPGFVVVENVPGISSNPESPLGKFITSLKDMKYDVARGVRDMSLYGIPQKRRRFTLLASRVSEISLPEPTGKTRTVRDVLGTANGFPRIEAGTKDETKFLHASAGLSAKNLERLRMTRKDGGDRSCWQKKKAYRLPCYASDEKKFPDTYGRMWWDRPAPTITTKFFSVTNGRFAHPEEDRGLSLREGATLQTFPKDYEFIGTGMGPIAKMIGNAFPPDFAKLIGERVVSSLENTHN